MCRVLTLLAIVAVTVGSYQQPNSDTMSLSNDAKIKFDYGLTNEPKDCPTWTYFANVSGDCVCGVTDFHAVKCDQSIGKVYILDSYQMTYDEEYQQVVVGASLYGISHPGDQFDIYHEVPMNVSELNEAMCGPYNRKGRLCGECKESYSPLVYSYKISCEKCSEEESKHNILKFTMVVVIPLTAFYMVVVLFKFNANSPKVHGFILYAQLMSAPFVIRVLLANAYNMTTGVKVIATLYGIWNLDFFRTLYPDMCISLTTLQVISLDYIIAIYPLLLMILTLLLFKLHFHDCKIIRCVWHPFYKCLLFINRDWGKQVSMIDVFATFLLLSFGRVMSVSFNLLIYTSVVNPRGEFRGRYLYYDPSYEFFGEDHLPYGILALFMLICFNVLPLLLLSFYPMKCFQTCLNRFKLSCLALHTFADSFAGCYKDGTEPGTRDCRYFAGLYLLIRIFCYIVYEVIQTDVFYGIFGIVSCIVLFLYFIIQPYKPKYAVYNKVTLTMITAIVITILSESNVVVAYNKMYQAANLSIALLSISFLVPQLYVICIALRWIGIDKFLYPLKRLLLNTDKSQSLCEVSPLINGDGRV
jgi:hypothetical protein